MPRAASITFDMDGLDVIAQGYGVTGPFKPVIYLKAVPRMLELLDEVGLKATFFIVTKNLDHEQRQSLRLISSLGHEIANHSHSHSHVFSFSREQTRREIFTSNAIIEDAVGLPVMGYRSPSFIFNRHVMDALVELEYVYDSSINPTWFFMGEWIYGFLLNPSRRNLPRLFYLKHAFAPASPYPVSPPSFFRPAARRALIELPVSRVPLFGLPFYATFHFAAPMTYRLFLRRYLSNKYIVYLGHALDFLDIEQDGLPSRFGRHPGMAMSWKEKKNYYKPLLETIKSHSETVCPAVEMARMFKETSA